MRTSFTAILERCVAEVPAAIGAIFAAWDGEAVDQVSATGDPEEMLILGAHYGVVLNQVQSALHLFHFGEAEEIVFQHERMELLLRAVGDGYYVVLAVRGRTHLATALREVARAAAALRAEM